MGNYIIFGRVRKSEERRASKKFNNKCFENSRSQIVFRTGSFQKLSLGAPVILSIIGYNLPPPWSTQRSGTEVCIPETYKC